MADSSSERPDPVVTRSGHVTIERQLEIETRGVIVKCTLRSTSPEPLLVEVVDYLPGNWTVDEIGFHDGYGPRSGTATGDVVSFDVLVRPPEEAVVVYGVTLAGDVDPEGIREAQEFSPPHVDDVEPAAPDDVGSVRPIGTRGSDELSAIDDPAELFERAAAEASDGKADEEGAAAPVPDAEAGADGGAWNAVEDADADRPVANRLVSEIRAGSVSDEQLEALRRAILPLGHERTRVRLQRIESRLEEFDAYVEELGAVIDEHGAVTEFVSELRADLDAAERETASLRSAVDAAAEERSTLNDRVDSIEASTGEREDRLAEAEERTTATASRLEELDATVADAETSLAAVEADLSDLQAALDSLGDRVDDWESVRGRLLAALDPREE